MKPTFRPVFEIEQRVYGVVGEEVGVVTEYLVSKQGIRYGVRWGDMTTDYHYDFELRAEKSFTSE
jgi:hypothetical protein